MSKILRNLISNPLIWINARMRVENGRAKGGMIAQADDLNSMTMMETILRNARKLVMP